MTEYSESDLVLPTLQLLDQNQGGLTTTQLIHLLEAELRPDGHDVEIINNRQDTYFSQKVRNLVSHRTLQKRGFVDYSPEEHLHRLTPTGRQHLADSVGTGDGETTAAPTSRHERFAPYRPADEDPQREQPEPFEVDPDAVDRATGAHARIQNALAQWIQDLGLHPLRPAGGEVEFDLAWETDDALYVAEVKSLTQANETRQLRLGLGQVLHYGSQLRRGHVDVRPVLVVEREPSDRLWLDLCEEVGVLLTWPGAFDPVLQPEPPLVQGVTPD